MRTTGQYKSILDLVRKLYQGEGWRVFYRGYFANSLGGESNSQGFNQLILNCSPSCCGNRFCSLRISSTSLPRESHFSRRTEYVLFRISRTSIDLFFLGLLTLTMISNVSALAAMYASYPLYLIRTRQQYQIVPENMFEMIGRIWR